jgi:DNA-binding GntR family transcriptional regulator
LSSSIKRPTGLAEEVYSRLYDQLVTHGIAPGDRLSVDGLARSLGVSQTPVREALSRLEAQGLVVKAHLVGYRAADRIGRERLEQIYELRLLTEPHLARLAARRISTSQAAHLTGLTTQMEGLAGHGAEASYAEFSRVDEAFHRAIARASGNNVIEDALGKLHLHVHLFRMSQPNRAMADAVVEHDAIVTALTKGDSEAAERAMREHILCSRSRYTQEPPDDHGAADAKSGRASTK